MPDPLLHVQFDADGYLALLGRILNAHTAGALEALVPEIVHFTSSYRHASAFSGPREELAKAWWQTWQAHVGTPIRSDLWPTDP